MSEPTTESIIKMRIEGLVARLNGASHLLCKSYYEDMLHLLSQAHCALNDKQDLLLTRDTLQEATELTHAQTSEQTALRKSYDSFPNKNSDVMGIQISNELKELEFIQTPLTDITAKCTQALQEQRPTPSQLAEKMRRMAQEVTSWELLDPTFRTNMGFRLSNCAELATQHNFKSIQQTLTHATEYCNHQLQGSDPSERHLIERLRATLQEICAICTPSRPSPGAGNELQPPPP